MDQPDHGCSGSPGCDPFCVLMGFPARLLFVTTSQTILHAASCCASNIMRSQSLRTFLAVSGHFCAALATELPSPDLLLESPHGRTESVINRRMWKHILVQGCYQILVLFLVIFGAPKLIGDYAVRPRLLRASCCNTPPCTCNRALAVLEGEYVRECMSWFCPGICV